MTTKEFILNQRRIFNELKTKNIPLQRAADDTHIKMVKRIFSDGGAVSGEIGSYDSTTPINVSKKNAVSGASGFFESYKAFRASAGRPTSFVNLSLTQDLELDFSNQGKTTKLSPLKRVSTIDRPENIKKAEGNEKHFGKIIFALRASEKKNFLERIDQALGLQFAKL